MWLFPIASMGKMFSVAFAAHTPGRTPLGKGVPCHNAIYIVKNASRRAWLAGCGSWRTQTLSIRKSLSLAPGIRETAPRKSGAQLDEDLGMRCFFRVYGRIASEAE